MTCTMIGTKALMALTGLGRTTLYHHIKDGLLPRGVAMSCGGRAVRYPLEDVQEVLRARVAGKSDVEVRSLVRRLRAAHSTSGVL